MEQICLEVVFILKSNYEGSERPCFSDLSTGTLLTQRRCHSQVPVLTSDVNGMQHKLTVAIVEQDRVLRLM